MMEVRVTHIWKDSRLVTSNLPSPVELEPSSIIDLWTPDSYFHHTKELRFVRLSHLLFVTKRVVKRWFRIFSGAAPQNFTWADPKTLTKEPQMMSSTLPPAPGK